MSPCVDGEAKRSEAEQTNPAHGYRGKECADPAGDDDEDGDGGALRPTDTSVSRWFGDNKLRRKREEVVDHRADVRKRREKNDANDRVHSLTLLEGTKW